LKVSDNAVLIVSYLGYRTEKIAVGNKTRIDIVLSETAEMLDEVVAIGYGTVRRGDLTGAVSSANVASMAKAPVSSFDQALAGRVAGMQLSAADGQPGRGSNIVIRGASSLTQSISPIYVVDGFVLEVFDPHSLYPQDIESINVLKDASSTAIYGAQGSSGVIVITTKKAKIGKPTINYNASIGVNHDTKRLEMMDPYEYMKFTIERFPDQARWAFYPDLVNGETMDPEVYRDAPTIDWQDQVLRTGFTQIHNLSMSGGSQSTKYLTSLNYTDQQGSVINTDYNKVVGRFMLDQTINKRLSLKLNAYYTRDHASGIVAADHAAGGRASSYIFYSVYGYRPVVSLDPEAMDDFLNSLVDDQLNGMNDYRLNPRIAAENTYRNTFKTTFTPSVNLVYKFNNHLTLTVYGALMRQLQEANYFYNSQTVQGYTRPGIVNMGVQGGVSFNQYNTASNENMLSYSNIFNRIHKLDVQAGLSFKSINTSYHALKYQNIPYEELGLSGIDEGVPVSGQNSYLTESKGHSLFARVNYGLLSRYLFTVTGRADGSSKFAPEHRWGYFPSAAFAWRLSGEPILRELAFLYDAKLRFSYGVSGNDRVGDYDYLAKLDASYSSYYSYNNGTPEMGASRTSLGNADLKWESTAQTNVGIDLSLFQNRVNLTVDWYKKKTEDLLMRANLPTVTGFTTGFKNIGSIENRGWEFSLSTVNIETKNFSWSSDFNISFNKNKVLALNGEQDYMETTVSWEQEYNSTPLYRAIIGQPVSQFWGLKFDGIYQYADFDATTTNGTTTYTLKSDIPANGKARDKILPGDVKYKDQNDDLIVNSEDRVAIGNPLPKHTGGFGNDFRYKNLSLNVFFQWSYGGDVFNATRLCLEGGYPAKPLVNQLASYVNRWTEDNPSNEMFRNGVGAAGSGAGLSGVYSSNYIEDGSFLRLKTVSLDWNLPSSLLKHVNIRKLSLGMAAQNIYTWTSYSGVDPEVSVRHSILTPNFDFSAYPQSFQVVFNLKLTL
jgi:TonB-linked SusC/RagA family outer membrane protein